MQSSNPVLSRYEKTDKSGFAYDEGRSAYAQATGPAATATGAVPPNATDAAFRQVTAAGGLRLTINDVIIKTMAVFAVTVVFAIAGWNLVETMPWILWVGMLGGLALGLVNAFKKVPSPPLILLYAALQGIMLGAISNWYDQYAQGNEYQGIVAQAVIATMTTFGVMLVLYITGIVKVTKRFQSVMIVALVSYLILGVGSMIWAMFGGGGGWGIYGTGFGVIVAVFGVLIAAFFLMLDFEAISQGLKNGAPERESWRMAFGLLVTLIWLYLEFLRLLAIFTRN